MIPSKIPRVMLKSFPEEKIGSLQERFSNLESRLKEQPTPRNGDFRYYSSPGRTELGGNHTDHNNGSVLAGSVDLDMVAVVHPRTDSMVTLQSIGYSPVSIDLDDTERKSHERGSPASIIRGIANWLSLKGLPQCSGFDIAMDSEIPAGSGLSSSAAFEMLVAAIYDDIGNYGLSPTEWAIAGKYAENEYFGKPCGLMDQLACGLGGIVFIDFAKQESPRIEMITFDFAEFGYALAIVSTGSGHEDLTDEYASIPQEMKTVAHVFGQNTLQGISCEDLLKNIAKIRSQCGDRAFLRAWHFVHETERPGSMVNALQNRDLKAYLRLVQESGNSSWRYLQNVIGTQTAHQNLGIALAIAEKTIGEHGACRVHGGGFAGAIQAYLPHAAFRNFSRRMEEIFGHKSVQKIALRPFGVCKIMTDTLK